MMRTIPRNTISTFRSRLGAGAIFVLLASAAGAQEWRPIPAGGKFNVSGMARVKQEENRATFLIVQDNKRPEEDRAGIVSVERDGSPAYLPLRWPEGTDLPRDLEAVCGVPGSDTEYAALDSGGRLYRLQLTEQGSSYTLAVLGTVDLPQVLEQPNYEGLALQKLGEKDVLIWAHRGANADPAVLGWTVWEPATGKVRPDVKTQEVRVSWPAAPEVRHISDLKVDPAGVVYITAASDPGNFGPFQSAAYVAGALIADKDGVRFSGNTEPVRIQTSRYNKAEALELLPGKQGGLVLGSDDETVGGAVWIGF